MNFIKELDELIKDAGLKLTFDPDRSWAKPCFHCGTTEHERELVDLGNYLNKDKFTRPLCLTCKNNLAEVA